MPTVELPAGRLHYVEQGDGPPVVLLHGVLMDHALWDDVIDRLPTGFRYVRPVLPLGAHPEPMRPGADLSPYGFARLIADFLAALDLTDVTLVHTDWGGGLFLTAYGLDERVSRIIALPCEAYENFPPGLPGRALDLCARVPGALSLGCRLLRIGWVRRTPPMLGRMVRRPVADDLARRWTAPGIAEPRVLADLRTHLRSSLPKAERVASTEALQRFAGDALILWSSAGKVMPREHGRRLAELIPRGRLVEIDDAYVFSMLDRPDAVAAAMSAFLRERVGEAGPGRPVGHVPSGAAGES